MSYVAAEKADMIQGQINEVIPGPKEMMMMLNFVINKQTVLF